MSKPGPAPFPPGEKKTERVRLYGNDADFAAWKAAADAKGKTINELARDLLNMAAKKYRQTDLQ